MNAFTKANWDSSQSNLSYLRVNVSPSANSPAAISPSAITALSPTSGFYVRLVLPSGDSTVLMADENMSIGELLKALELKKDIGLDEAIATVVFPDGSKVKADTEQILANFKGLERILLTGNIISGHPLPNPPTRRGSVLNAPASRNTNVRMSTDAFPHTVVEQTESVRGSVKLKHNLKAALNSLFSKKTDEGSTESLNKSMSSHKKASINHMNEHRSSNALANDAGNSKNSLSLTTESLRHSNSNNNSSSNVGSVSSTPIPPPLLKSPSVGNTFEEAGPLNVAILPRDSTTEHSYLQQNYLAGADMETPSSTTLPRLSRSSTYSPSSIIPQSVGNHSVINEMQSVPTANKLMAPSSRRRSQTVSNPLMKIELKRTMLNELEKSRSALGTPEGGARNLVFKLHVLEQPATIIKMSGENTMEEILFSLAGKRGLEAETLTFELDAAGAVEMDRRLEYYVKEHNPIDIYVVKKAKVYSTITVSEDGVDVLVLQIIRGTNQIMASELEKIFELLTSSSSYTDENFINMVLLTFRSFISAEEFLSKLLSRFYCQLPDNPSPTDVAFFEANQVPTQKRVLSVLRWWIEHHWHDFGLSTSFRKVLEEFEEEVLVYNAGFFMDEARDLINLTDQKKEWFEAMLSAYQMGERKGKALESMLSELEPEDMAQQLCIYNYQIFKNIHPIEFLNEIWKKDNDASPSFRFFVERFDKESYWVATELIAVKDLKKRANVLKKFIYLAKCSLELNNFFSTFALIAGLNLTPVQRLKKTWEALGDKTKKVWSEVEKMADPSRNMKNYRDKLLVSSPPMVPFLPIYLKDLTFINDGNASKIRGLINVDKLRMMANRVLEITSLANQEYPFEPKPAIINYLAKTNIEKNMNKLKEQATELENSSK